MPCLHAAIRASAHLTNWRSVTCGVASSFLLATSSWSKAANHLKS